MPAITGDDLQKAFKRVKQAVRSKAKEASAPLFYVENGKYIREEPNGDKFIRVLDSDGILKDYKVR
ncbi:MULTISPECIES: hypothetical protein [Paenibacillus]|uniref:hypothetical protein n=1 Tax=Paenibacillus TaxID=44249 RepID=UPI002FE32A0B